MVAARTHESSLSQTTVALPWPSTASWEFQALSPAADTGTSDPKALAPAALTAARTTPSRSQVATAVPLSAIATCGFELLSAGDSVVGVPKLPPGALTRARKLVPSL